MKLLLATLFLLTPLIAFGQCQDSATHLCVARTDVDKAVAAAIELKAARATIDAFAQERTATEQERASAARLIDRLNAVISLQDRMSAEYEKALTMYKQVLTEAFALIERQQKMLNRGKSGFDKFLGAVKAILTLAAGVTIGRGL